MDSGLPFDTSSEVHGREGLTLAVGGGKVRGGNNLVWGEGVTWAELQKERDGGDSLLLATTDSSIRQQHRTTLCALKHTCGSYKPGIYMDNGFPFDTCSEVHVGEGLALAVGGGKVRGGSRRVWGEGVTRVELQKDREGGDSLLLATTDSTVLGSNTARPSAR